MKRTRKLLILLGVLITTCVLTLSINEYEEDKITASEKVILNIPVEELTGIKWEHSGETLAFYKEEDIWYYEEDDDFPVDADMITLILSSLEEITSTFKITDVEDYSQYGLNDPECTIVASKGEITYTIQLGDFSVVDGERYATINDENVYLLKYDLMEDFNYDLDDIIKLDNIPSMKQVNKYSITGDRELEIVYQEDSGYCYSDEFVYYLKDGKEYLPLSKSLTETFIDNIEKISWIDHVSYTADQDDLSDYGLDVPNYTVNFEYLDQDDESQTLQVSFASKGNKYYAQIQDSQFIYTISSSTYNKLKDTLYEDLRPSEVILLDWSLVDQIGIELDEEEYIVISKGSKNSITYSYLDREVDFDTVIDTLSDLEIVEFTEEEPTKKKELTILITQSVENYPKIELEFYQFNGENCLVVFNDVSLGLVSRESVVDLKEEINSIVLD